MKDKVILVIDKPKTCLGCPCYSFNAQTNRFECNAKLFLKGKIGVVELDKKPNWCLLKPLPKKFNEGIEYDIKKGGGFDKYLEIGFKMGWDAYYDKTTENHVGESAGKVNKK